MTLPADKPRILLIEDELAIRKLLRVTLTHHQFDCIESETGQDGLARAAEYVPDVVVLDLGLPDLDGLEVIRRLRDWSRAPIIVLTARGQEGDKVAALDAGADDYVTKPFSVQELLARIRVALRHASTTTTGEGNSTFSIGDLRVDLLHRRVFSGGKEVHLTPIEYRLLTTLVKHAGKVLTHQQLLKEVWGPGTPQETHYLRVYMAQLRRKLEVNSADPTYLLTEPGVGYRFAGDIEP
jgi:two-component system, OmpR family, KDP operon response regulator KdpE